MQSYPLAFVSIANEVFNFINGRIRYKRISLKRYSINNVFKGKKLEEKSNVQFLHIANSDSAVKDSLTAQDEELH